MSRGLLDLPAPLLDALDAALGAVALPPGARVALYAAASAWLCMALYRRLSRQDELGGLAARTRALRAELAGYDGPFDGLMQRVRELLRLSGRHLRLSFVPALVAGLPLLLLLPWLSNQFGLRLPTVGEPITLRAVEPSVETGALVWSDAAARWDAEAGAWILAWPSRDAPVRLTHRGAALLELPLPAPAGVVHAFVPGFNHLIGNPAGYLPEGAPLAALEIDLPAQALQPFGPAWLRGWMALYFGVLIAVSLVFKWRWKLQ